MSRLLVLTKNILAEQKLQERLHQLNIEVYCSTLVYQQLLEETGKTTILDHFPAVILSENLSDEEVERIMPYLFQKKVIRKVEQTPAEDKLVAWKKAGITTVIALDMPTEELRETLCQLTQPLEVVSQLVRKNYHHITFDQLALSGHESKFLVALVKRQGAVVSRKELCQLIWDNEHTRSNLVQLSCIVQRIRTKLEKNGIAGEHLERVWGTGYKCSPELIGKLTFDD
ncbi:winged helix-turn-helix domain-containing protein [Enterococcus sp. CSURQ0835]|uniref:winged helix-turn-helix domain-containing protein n=1 Tax=Enterococcus sp. CSURQ0835 TaxID=2681394 RepID=UPI001356D313|nr:helix-turn-helix domain-containing protein [Enterococcus sp. CSURQ0835]